MLMWITDECGIRHGRSAQCARCVPSEGGYICHISMPPPTKETPRTAEPSTAGPYNCTLSGSSLRGISATVDMRAPARRRMVPTPCCELLKAAATRPFGATEESTSRP